MTIYKNIRILLKRNSDFLFSVNQLSFVF